MKQTTNLKKLEPQDPLVDLVHDAVDEEEEKLNTGLQMYETYGGTYEKIKRKPKLQKAKRRR